MPGTRQFCSLPAISNLQGICEAGDLLSKNLGASNGIDYQNIAHVGAQGARSVRNVPDPPGGVVHDYVPFYFAPRSPMLLAIEKGRVEGCQWRQADIVHFETTVVRVTEDGAPFIFYDRNATLHYSTPYTDLAKLDAIAWELLTESPTLDGFCKYWQNRNNPAKYADRMERRQAEFLVRHRVPLEMIVRIGVNDEARATEVRAIVAGNGVDLPVETKRDWYF